MLSGLVAFLRTSWAWLAAVLGATVLLTGALTSWQTVNRQWQDWFGRDDTHLLALQARLMPFRSTVPDPLQHDQFSLQVLLRNDNAEPVLLTSARLTMERAGNAAIGPGGSGGQCVLAADRRDNMPVRLEPGAARWIGFSPMVRLPGFTHWLEASRFADGVHPLDGGLPGVHELAVVPRVNEAMARLFGRDARIRLVLYAGEDERRRTLRFYLAQGKDLFARDGSLLYDAMIGLWLTGELPQMDCAGG